MLARIYGFSCLFAHFTYVYILEFKSEDLCIKYVLKYTQK